MSNDQIEQLMSKVQTRYQIAEMSLEKGIWITVELNTVKRTTFDTELQAEIRVAELIEELQWVNFEGSYLTIIKVYERKILV